MTRWFPSPLKPGIRRYLAITEAIGDDIASGRLRPGERLPPHRHLAFRLGVSINTASHAYTEAIRRGLIVSEVGRGTFVLPSRGADQSRKVLDFEDPGLLDLAYNCPVPSPHAAGALGASLAEIAGGSRLAQLLAYERPYLGLADHRRASTVWLEGLGLRVHPEQVVITAGAQHAMSVVLSSIAKPGDVILTEELTDPGLIFLAKGHHLRLRGLSVDSEGVTPDALDAACRAGQVTALACMPSHQSPTLSVMSEARREAIAAVARRHDIVVVENDTYGAFQDAPLPALSSFAAERSFYVTSLSKIMAPGLRIGFVATPPGRAEDLVPGLGATSWMASPILAEVAASWIRSGTASRLATQQRREMVRRHAVFREALPDADYTELPSSLHVWMRLPPRQQATVLARRAENQGVTIAPSQIFSVAHSPIPEAARISLGGGAANPAELRRGLSILAAIVGSPDSADHRGGSKPGHT